jgi:hypothetical protein
VNGWPVPATGPGHPAKVPVRDRNRDRSGSEQSLPRRSAGAAAQVCGGLVRDLIRWPRTARHWRRKEVLMTAQVQPVALANLLRQVPGKWVALRNDEIVEARDTLDELAASLEEQGIKDATVMRSPKEGEPELVGLG